MRGIGRAVDALYSILAHRGAIRDELLVSALEHKSVCALVSLRLVFGSRKLPKITRTYNTNTSYNSMLSNIITLLNGSDTKALNAYFITLPLDMQVVLHGILSTKSEYNYIIIDTYINKVYSKDELLTLFNDGEQGSFQYVLLENSSIYFKTRHLNITWNTVPSNKAHVEPPRFTTYIYDSNGEVIGSCDDTLQQYLKGNVSQAPKILKAAKAQSMVDIQVAVNNSRRFRVAKVFTPSGIITLNKESKEYECKIIDVKLNDDFEIEGVYFTHNDVVGYIKQEAPLDIIGNYTIVVKGVELLDGTLSDIDFIKYKEIR